MGLIMSNNKLDLSALTKAVHSLGVALTQSKNEFTRDAVIQRYEYTFELAWKMIKRYLSMEAGIDEYNIKNILRIAAQQQLIDNLDEWVKYHKARNLTSQTYNEKTTEET